jgi:molybdopterin-guanine dinucleotide biosynthesis protein A
VSYPVSALAAVCERVAVVCKPDTELPELDEGIERWDEAEEGQHPRTGIVHALERAGGPVLVCAADMPFVTADAFRTLLAATGSSSAVVAVSEGILQPVLGLYALSALEALRDAPEHDPLTETVESLHPSRVALPPAVVRGVNTPEDRVQAEELIRAAARQ